MEKLFRLMAARCTLVQEVTVEDILLTPQETAKRLRVSHYRVYRLVRARLIPFVRLGRQLRFSPRQLEEFLQAGGRGLPTGGRDARGHKHG